MPFFVVENSSRCADGQSQEILRRIAARAEGDLDDAIGLALKTVTVGDILGWFRHGGLCPGHG
jgi:hypothetical protein